MDTEQIMKYKNDFKKSIIFVTTLFLVLGFYAGAYSKKESLDFFDTILGIFDYILEHPLGLYPVDWFYPFLFALIAGFCDMYLYYDYIRRKNSMPDKEHGTSKFNDNLQKFRREFVYDPNICVKKKRFKQRILHMIYFPLSFLPYWKDKEDDLEEDDEYYEENMEEEKEDE